MSTVCPAGSCSVATTPQQSTTSSIQSGNVAATFSVNSHASANCPPIVAISWSGGTASATLYMTGTQVLLCTSGGTFASCTTNITLPGVTSVLDVNAGTYWLTMYQGTVTVGSGNDFTQTSTALAAATDSSSQNWGITGANQLVFGGAAACLTASAIATQVVQPYSGACISPPQVNYSSVSITAPFATQIALQLTPISGATSTCPANIAVRWFDASGQIGNTYFTGTATNITTATTYAFGNTTPVSTTTLSPPIIISAGNSPTLFLTLSSNPTIGSGDYGASTPATTHGALQLPFQGQVTRMNFIGSWANGSGMTVQQMSVSPISNGGGGNNPTPPPPNTPRPLREDAYIWWIAGGAFLILLGVGAYIVTRPTKGNAAAQSVQPLSQQYFSPDDTGTSLPSSFSL